CQQQWRDGPHSTNVVRHVHGWLVAIRVRSHDRKKRKLGSRRDRRLSATRDERPPAGCAQRNRQVCVDRCTLARDVIGVVDALEGAKPSAERNSDDDNQNDDDRGRSDDGERGTALSCVACFRSSEGTDETRDRAHPALRREAVGHRWYAYAGGRLRQPTTFPSASNACGSPRTIVC